MPERLRLGIIGLGRRWSVHYRPALLTLRDRFVVRAVTDPCPRRAAAVSRDMNCPAAPGILALLDTDLDAILLLGRPWFRLWPLEQACRVGRPVYLGMSLAVDDSKADEVVRQARIANLPVMAELLPRLAPATDRLRGLLPKLGALRSVICTVSRRGRGVESAQAAGLAMVDWCTAFLGTPLAEIQGFEDSSGHAAWLLHFAGAVAQLWTWPGIGSSMRVRLVGTKGSALALFPRRVRWRIGRTRHAIDLPAGLPPIQRALEEFHSTLTAGRPPTPSLDDAFQALTRLRSARRDER